VIICDKVADKLPVKVIRIIPAIVFAALDALILKAKLATLPKHGGPILNRCNARLAGYAPIRRSVSYE